MIAVDEKTGEVMENSTEKKWRDIDKSSPYKEFVQLNMEGNHEEILRKLIHRCPAAAEMMIFLFKHVDKRNALVCSSKVLEEALGLSRATITRATKFLKDEKIITIKKSGTTNVFLLNADVAWKSWGKNHEYAEFEAKLIISKSEQEDTAKITKKNYPVVSCENEKECVE